MRTLAVPVLLAALAAAWLGVTGTPLLLLAMPVLLVAALGLWLRMSPTRVLDAVAAPEEDPGRGPAGLLP